MALVVTKNQKLDADLGLLKNDVVWEPLQLSAPIAFSDKMETGRIGDNRFDCPLDFTEESVTQDFAALIVVVTDARVDVPLE